MLWEFKLVPGWGDKAPSYPVGSLDASEVQVRLNMNGDFHPKSQIMLNGHSCNALLDTGSNISLVALSSNLLVICLPKMINPFSQPKVRLSSASSHQIHFKGVFELSFNVHGHGGQFPFLWSITLVANVFSVPILCTRLTTQLVLEKGSRRGMLVESEWRPSQPPLLLCSKTLLCLPFLSGWYEQGYRLTPPWLWSTPACSASMVN